MPRLKMFVRRLQKPLILVLLWACSIPLCLSQTEGRVENVQPGNVLALVSGVLQAHYHGLQKVEIGTHDLISNYEEFRAHLLPYRAHFRFHLDANSLFVTMEDLESPGNGTWNRSLIPPTLPKPNSLPRSSSNSTQPISNWPSLQYLRDQPECRSRYIRASGIARRHCAGFRARATHSTFHLARHTATGAGEAPCFRPVCCFSRHPLRKIQDHSLCRGMCAIRKNGLWGFVDYKGNLVLDFRYHTPGSIFPPISAMASAW